jgi:hypothetical protein
VLSSALLCSVLCFVVLLDALRQIIPGKSLKQGRNEEIASN